MRKGFTLGLALLCSLMLLFANPTQTGVAVAQNKKKYVTCKKVRKKDGWCTSCQVGYLKGRRLECKTCHDAGTSTAGACTGCQIASPLRDPCRRPLGADCRCGNPDGSGGR